MGNTPRDVEDEAATSVKQMEQEVAIETLYDRLRGAKYDIREAQATYDDIMDQLFKAGQRNVRIAREIGVTEAAVRNYRKRKNERGIKRG